MRLHCLSSHTKWYQPKKTELPYWPSLIFFMPSRGLMGGQRWPVSGVSHQRHHRRDSPAQDRVKLWETQLPFPNLSNLNASDLSKISQISIIIIELDLSNSKAGEIKKSYIIIMYPKRNEKSSIKTIHRLFWASLNYIALVKVFDTM